MGIKAKETIRRETASFVMLLVVLAALIGFQYGYAYLIERVSESSKSIISGVAMVLSLSVTLFVVRKVVPWYEIQLTNKFLIVNKAMFLKARPLISVPVKEITDIKTLEETEDFSGRKINYTIFGIKDKKKYVISWKRENKNIKIILQLGDDFAEKVKREAARGQKK